MKDRCKKREATNLYFYRDSSNNEVDLLPSDGAELIAIASKISSTYRVFSLTNLKKTGEVDFEGKIQLSGVYRRHAANQ